jgi:hypothetical protein
MAIRWREGVEETDHASRWEMVLERRQEECSASQQSTALALHLCQYQTSGERRERSRSFGTKLKMAVIRRSEVATRGFEKVFRTWVNTVRLAVLPTLSMA